MHGLKARLLLTLMLFSNNQLLAHIPTNFDPFTESSLSHGFHFHLPIEYAVGEGMHYGIHTEFGGHSDFSIAPILAGTMNRFTRIINLEHEVQSLSRAGYRVIKKKEIDIGLGVDFHVAFGLPALSLGLLPSGSVKAFVQKWVPTLEEAKNFKKPIIPSNLEELRQWTIGDRVFYRRDLGLALHLSAGLEPFVYTGPVYHIGGEWLVGYEKIGETTLRLSIQKSKIQSIGYELDGIFFSVSTEGFKGVDEGFVFDIDFKSENEKQIFKEILSGRLVRAQKIEKINKKFFEDAREKTRSKFRGVSALNMYMIPLLWGIFSQSGRTYSETIESSDDEGDHTIFSSIVYDQTNTVGMLSKHLSHRNISLSNLELGKSADEMKFASVFSWTYEKNKFSSHKIEKKIDHLIRKVGFQDQINLSFEPNQKGYAKISYFTRISMAAIIQLVNRSSIPDNFVQRVDDFKKKLKTEISNPDFKTECNISHSSCLKNLEKKGIKSIKKIDEFLNLAKKEMYHGHYLKFSRYISKAVDLMHTNSLILYTILNDISGVEFLFNVQGERFKIVDLKLSL